MYDKYYILQKVCLAFDNKLNDFPLMSSNKATGVLASAETESLEYCSPLHVLTWHA